MLKKLLTPRNSSLFLILLVLLMAFVIVTVAFAAPVPGSYYTLKAVHSGKCMDVQATNTADGAKIGQYTCNGYLWQNWSLVDKGSGYYNIVSQNSGKCLDVNGASTADGAQLIQWTCGSGTNQQWQLVASGSNYQLKARHSGKCAGVVGSSTADSALVQQQTCTTGNNQKWTFTVVGSIPPTATPGPTPIGGNKNPVLPGKYADPTGIIMDNTFYIYPTTDGITDWLGTSFKVFSSTNMINWTDRGVILDLANISWCTTHNKAWAPSIIKRGSTYYFYFSACGQTGVASSSSATGPFTDLKGSALASQIDPMVFADTDGSYYLYWGQSTMKWGKLNADMKSFSSTGSIAPSGFNEGSFVFKRNGIYYFMWSENDTRSEDYRVAYGTATSATGAGFVKKGIILSKNTALGILGTGHHSVIATSSGAYYIVYHRFYIPGGNGFNREVCIDKLEFNTDGTIKTVIPTLAGITSPVAP
jgi:hypothetical protein